MHNNIHRMLSNCMISSLMLGLLMMLAGCTTNQAVSQATIANSYREAAITEPEFSADRHAELRLAQGLAITNTAQGEPEALRTALDQFSIGVMLAPAGSALHTELVRYQTATAALLDATRDPTQAAQLCGEAAAIWPEGTAQMAVCTNGSVSPEPPVVSLPAQRSAATQRPVQPTPTQRPQPPSFAVTARKSFDDSAPSGQYAACIDIQVLGRNGPLGGAVVGINNGEHSYQNQTDANGYTGRCGLGASTWSVVLFWAPPDHSVAGAATTVWVNGAPEQRAAVVFQEQ